MRVQSAEGRLRTACERGMAPGGKWLACIRGDQVGGERVSGGSLRRCVRWQRGAGGPWLQAALIEPGAPDRSWECRAGLQGRRHLRPGARGPRPELFIQEGPRGGACTRDLGCRASGGAGVPDSRINVLKATTPSSPCRKMPKLCMSAPLSQRPAPDAAVEDPPGSPRLAFPAGPCMTEPAEERGRRVRTATLPAGAAPRARARARSPESKPAPPPRRRLSTARNPTSEIAAPDWPGAAWGGARPRGSPLEGRGSGRARGGVVSSGHR